MTRYTHIDNFKILNHLGNGGFAQVHLVEDVNSKKKYAVKIAKPKNNHISDTTLINEFQIMSQVDHPHVLKFHKLVSHGKLITKQGESIRVTYGVLELSEGGELFSLLFNSGKF